MANDDEAVELTLTLPSADVMALCEALRVFEMALAQNGLDVLVPGSIMTLRHTLEEWRLDHAIDDAIWKMAERERINEIMEECDL